MLKIAKIKRAGTRHIQLEIFFFKFKFQPRKKRMRPVTVILGPVGIGDYMCYRPYFKYIRKSPRFKNAYILYIARDIYADFTQNFDSEFFNEIITVNINSILYNSTYRKCFAKIINSYKPDIIYTLTPFHPKNGEHPLPLKLFPLIKAKVKIAGCLCSRNQHILKNDKFSKIFNKILYQDCENDLFETERTKYEIEKFLDIKIPEKISNELFIPFKSDKKNIAISLIANTSDRMYSSEKWINIINYLTQKTDNDTNILFIGAKKDEFQLQNIINKLKYPQRCINLAGKLIISMIPALLNSCKFLISVESGNVHIAHAAKIPTICISGTTAYGRFHPYKDKIVRYIYPDALKKFIENLPPPIKVFQLCHI